METTKINTEKKEKYYDYESGINDLLKKLKKGTNKTPTTIINKEEIKKIHELIWWNVVYIFTNDKLINKNVIIKFINRKGNLKKLRIFKKQGIIDMR